MTKEEINRLLAVAKSALRNEEFQECADAITELEEAFKDISAQLEELSEVHSRLLLECEEKEFYRGCIAYPSPVESLA